MPNGTPTAGMVLAFFSEPASLCFCAAVVVDGAVPDKGCTYFTRSWLYTQPVNPINKLYKSSFFITELFSCSVVQLFSCSVVQLFSCSVVQLFSCSVVQLFKL